MNIADLIRQYAVYQPEGFPLCPQTLTHLGDQNTVEAALNHMTDQGILSRICDGVHVLLKNTRFGPCNPPFEHAVPQLADLWNETIVPSGGAAANALSLSSQVPVRPVYLTSGPDRTLWFGNLEVTLRHAPDRLLANPNTPEGDRKRAMEWLQPA